MKLKKLNPKKYIRPIEKEIRDRVTLAILIVLLWIFLVIFQKYIPKPSSIFIILGFMFFYALLLHLAQKHQRRKLKKNPPKFDTTYEPFVSILIPAHNEENVINGTVLNILALDYAKYEIIVIDDRSTDKTALVLNELSKNYSDKVKFFTRSNDSFPGKSAVLNEALNIAEGEIICVFDADARIKPDFLKKMLPYLSDPDIGAVQSRKIISNRNVNLLTRCQNNEYALDAHFQRGRDSIRGAVELRGNGQLIKKEALIDVDGWNNHTITDDLDLSTRLHLKNHDIRFCFDAEVYEEAITSFMPLLRQRRRWVEGSIRRYLDYFIRVLFSKKVPLRVSVDMWAYISEFVLPVWLISEWAIQGIKIIRGVDENIFSSLAVLPFICIFFISGIIYSLRKYTSLSLYQCIKQGIETSIYMVIVWTPVVLFIVFKIIFMKRTMDWGKTVHGTAPDIEITPQPEAI